jgi:hypothetical protein
MPRVPNAPHPKAWMPPDWDKADAGALKALSRGDASPEQQKRGLDYIIKVLAGTFDMSYRPDSDRDTAFAEGKRWVGLQAIKLININLEKIPDARS